VTHGSRDVEVSLVNTNNRELLLRCLETIPAACEELEWHATVVDNASEDGSADLVRARFPWASLVRNERRLGFGANHNQVIIPTVRDGSARYVLILNEDTELEPRAVRALVCFCDEDPAVGAVGPVISGPDGAIEQTLLRFPTPGRQLLRALRLVRSDATDSGESAWLNAACVLVRSEALRAVGPLDERFFIFFEDTDLGLRLQRAGWSAAVCPAARIIHHGHQTVTRPSRGGAMELQFLRSRYLYFERHHGKPAAMLVAGLIRGEFAVRAVKASLAAVIRRDRAARTKAVALLRLARYNPDVPLPHELEAHAKQ
jgi:N-acetylglucosaminyl-diphospho-decaprenol L-rhamnosyltransferase